MPTAAVHSWGSILEIFDGAFIPIAELSVFAMSYLGDEIDVTHLISSGRWREFVQGLKSCEILVDGNLIIASDTHGFVTSHGLGTIFDTGEIFPWRIRFVNATPLTFSAFITEYTWVNDVADAIRFTARMRITGIITESSLIFDLWSEEFNYAALDDGEFVSQWNEDWDYYTEDDFIEQYTEEWSYENFQTANLQWLEQWDYAVPAEEDFVLEWTETWDS